MSPILHAALGSMLRHILTLLSGFLVTRGIWTEAEATTYVAASIPAILSILWSLYQKAKTHEKILKALKMPAGSTLTQLEKK